MATGRTPPAAEGSGTITEVTTRPATQTGFKHEALLYAGEAEFVERAAAFVHEGVEAGEAILVVVSARKVALLEEALGPAASDVEFADMREVGRNPARIIPRWRDFVERHAGTGAGMRGIGEPIDDSRGPDALLECERHEALLNVAFEGAPSWSLLCPYDTEALPPEVVAEALRNHPYVRNGRSRPSSAYRGTDGCRAPHQAALSDPPCDAVAMEVYVGALGALRDLVAREAAARGLDRREVEDFVLTVHELATNSIRHGGGTGTVRLWGDDGEVVAEIRDRGRIVEPLVGRVEPSLEVASGRGLWLANQLSDLVQIRVYPEGGVVRARLRKADVD